MNGHASSTFQLYPWVKYMDWALALWFNVYSVFILPFFIS